MLFIEPSNNHANAEGADTTRLCVLLEQICDLLAEHERCDAILVARVVDLNVLASLQEHGIEVWANSSVCHSKVWSYLFNFVNR